MSLYDRGLQLTGLKSVRCFSFLTALLSLRHNHTAQFTARYDYKLINSCRVLANLMEQTLLLNATYEPLKVVRWQKAVTLWCQGKVEVISVHDREVRSVSISLKLPSVIRLLRYIRIKYRFGYVPFSRANIYARDNHTCQYCGLRFQLNELTFDHVVPVAQGGRKDWENIVTCCITCNRRKGGRTPVEARMRVVRKPRRPTRVPAVRVTVGLGDAPYNWRDYLYWNVELENF